MQLHQKEMVEAVVALATESKNLMEDDPSMVIASLAHTAEVGEIGETRDRDTMIVGGGEEGQEAEAQTIAMLPTPDIRVMH